MVKSDRNLWFTQAYLAYHDKEEIPLSPGGALLGTFVTRFSVLFLLFFPSKECNQERLGNNPQGLT